MRRYPRFWPGAFYVIYHCGRVILLLIDITSLFIYVKNVYKKPINIIEIFIYVGGIIMDITSVTNTSNYSPMGDNIIQMLEKQKMQLQNQIQKVKEGKMDAKLKQQKVEELTEQITQIETQIRQEQMKKMRPEENKSDSQDSTNSQVDKTQSQNTGGGISSGYMISAVTGYSDLKTLGKVRTSLKDELRIATSSGENPGAGAGIQARLSKVEQDMQKKTNKINTDLKKASEEQAAKKEAIEENKQETTDVNVTESTTAQIVNDAEQVPPSTKKTDTVSNEEQSKNTSSKENKSAVENIPVQGKVVDIRI